MHNAAVSIRRAHLCFRTSSSPLAAHAVRTGTEMANRLLDVRRAASSVGRPGREPSFATSVRVALGAIERPGMASPEASVAAARGLLAKERDDQVLKVLEPLVSKPAIRENLRTRIEALLLAAIAADRLGDYSWAVSYLKTGLDLAAPADLRAPFLANSSLLGAMVDRYSWQLGSAYATELVDDLHHEDLPVFVEPLTPRESRCWSTSRR